MSISPVYRRHPLIGEHYPIAGVDEAGRGPLAGPVIAAAVIFNAGVLIQGLTDSKKLSRTRRETLYEEILRHSAAIGLGRSDPAEIDRINILQASLLAMRRAVLDLGQNPGHVLVDGNHAPDLPLATSCIVRGDALIPEISAASIIAKVTRDRVMEEMDIDYPGYGFARHKGYATANHILALRTLGPCPIHRMSYRPVIVCSERC